MSSKAFGLAVRHPTSLVFLFALAAGLVMAYARAEPPLSTADLVLLACLSLVYLFVGTVVFMIVLPSGSALQKIIYLAFQICLGMLIPREMEILRLIAAGDSNREIAAQLFIEGTGKNYVTDILGKLGVKDRTQAALKARDLKLI